MQVTQVSSFVFQLTRLRVFNVFLVEEDDGFTLVDTGLSGSESSILAAASDLGKPIRRIVLTHVHADHAGSLAALQTAVSEADLLLTARARAFLSGDMSLHANEPQARLRGSYLQLDVQPDARIEPGNCVGSLQVIATPGHTPDHVAYLDTRDGTLMAGDALQTQGGTAVAGKMRWLFPFPALATWHKPTAIESAKRLLALKPNRVAVGHGQPLENPVPQLQEAIREAENG